jgi:hypothetical protein
MDAAGSSGCIARSRHRVGLPVPEEPDIVPSIPARDDAASSSPEPAPRETGVTLRAAVLGGLATGFATTLAAAGVENLLWTVQHVVASVLATLGLVQIAHSLLRWRRHHWDKKKLRGRLWLEFALCGFVVLAAGVLGWLLPTEPLALLLLMVPVGCVVASADLLEHSIAERVADHRLETITDWIGGLTVDGRAIREAMAAANKGLLPRLVGPLLRPPATPSMSPMRVLMTGALFVACLTLAITSLAVAFFRPPQHVGQRRGSGVHHSHAHSQRPKRGSRALRSQNVTPTAPATPEVRWDQRCPAKPGADAPGWAKVGLYRLYLGPREPGLPPEATGPPGVDDGCTTPVVTPNPVIPFVYLTGIDGATGRVQTLAVDSPQFGPALYIAPAAQPVLGLIRLYSAVGGWPRIKVGEGDYYAVHVSGGGTVMLIRVQVNNSATTRAERYVELPIPVTCAWLEAMRLSKRWLWPTVRSKGGTETFHLLSRSIGGQTVATISYNTVARIAELKHGTRVRPYGSCDAISDEEVLKFAREAR